MKIPLLFITEFQRDTSTTHKKVLGTLVNLKITSFEIIMGLNH